MEIDDFPSHYVAHTPTQAVAAELRAERGRQQISQAALAKAIGRAQSYVSARLAGKESLSVDEYVTICHELKVKPDELLKVALSKYHAIIREVEGTQTMLIRSARADEEDAIVIPPSQDDLALAADEGYVQPEDSEVDDGA